jgi:hypothetical protein
METGRPPAGHAAPFIVTQYWRDVNGARASRALRFGRNLTPAPDECGSLLPLLHPMEERAGERRGVTAVNSRLPSSQPSPRSCVAGRGGSAAVVRVPSCAREVLAPVQILYRKSEVGFHNSMLTRALPQVTRARPHARGVAQ